MDNDILRIINDQLARALQNLSVSAICEIPKQTIVSRVSFSHPQPGLLSRFSPELELIIRSTLWSYSVCRSSASFGQSLLFMTYRPADLAKNYRLQLHFVLTVLLKYLKDNATFRFTYSERVQKIVNWCENSISVLNVLIWFRFLKCGQRPTIADFVLGLDNISYNGSHRREIGYNYITRELIWGGFMVSFGRDVT